MNPDWDIAPSSPYTDVRYPQACNNRSDNQLFVFDTIGALAQRGCAVRGLLQLLGVGQ
jgi:hypothetical protein